MGLFGRLFGSKDDLPALRKAVAQHRFADAHLIAQELDTGSLTDEERSEFEGLRIQAGDSLARLNLQEGLGLQRSGDPERAAEHLSLAQEQAASSELVAEVKKALKDLAKAPLTPTLAATPKAAGGSCASCGPAPAMAPLDVVDGDLPDFASQLELVLASYPPELAERYQSKSALFQEAIMLGHVEDEAAALKLLKKIPAEEKDDLFDFEVGSLLGRTGKAQEAIKYLKMALEKNPDHLLAAETLIMLQVSRKQGKEALARLEEMLDKGQDPAFCHGQLATLHLQGGEREKALEHSRQALAAGSRDPQIMLIAAGLMEQSGDVKGAENLYSALPIGGCGGGANLHLAEFWLRQNKNLAKSLDSFNAACRQEPENPRWRLRVAQTYIARKWDKQGLDLLRKVVNDPNLSAELKQEGRALLASKTGAQ
ncbi:MAG: tetratricopeptide repeat protein [Desulfuromonadales bacterium]|nr:tetratricopeptide repeat protein [Desulfuromonadales bacterium]